MIGQVLCWAFAYVLVGDVFTCCIRTGVPVYTVCSDCRSPYFIPFHIALAALICVKENAVLFCQPSLWQLEVRSYAARDLCLPDLLLPTDIGACTHSISSLFRKKTRRKGRKFLRMMLVWIVCYQPVFVMLICWASTEFCVLWLFSTWDSSLAQKAKV